MKRILFSIAILFFSINLIGQEIRFSAGPTVNYTNKNKDVGISTSKESMVLVGINSGIDYLFKSKNNDFHLGIGLDYQLNEISVSRAYEGSPDFQNHLDKIQLISLSMKSMFSLNKNLYLSLDPILDMQLKYDPEQFLDKQTGLGISAGVGKDIPLKDHFAFFIEPRVWIHNLVPLQDAVPTRLITFGLNLGFSFSNLK